MARSARTSSARTWPDDAATAALSRSFEVKAGGYCRLDVPHADVTLITGPEKRAEVIVTAAAGTSSEAASALVEQLRLHARYAEGTLRVEPDAALPRSADWWRRQRDGLPRLHLHVRVPTDFGATVHAPGSTVEASGLGGAVTLEVTGGQLHATALRGRLELYVHHSNAVVENFDGKKLIAHVHGSPLVVRRARAEMVTLEGAAAELGMEHIEAAVQLSVQSGAADLREIDGSLDAEVRGGRLSFAPESGVEATIRAPGGEVHLAPSQTLAADLQLSARRLFLKNLPGFEGERSKRHAEGSLHGGGALIEAHAPGGEVRWG